jgi:two-component system, NtrC family, response regulator GlrR
LYCTRSHRADVRVISACNTNLEEAVRSGRMRGDLYFRLNVLQLNLPPLRERREDIELLATHLLARHQAENSRVLLSRTAVEAMKAYDWPGNIRELENVIERALAISQGPLIGPDALGLPAIDSRVNGESFHAQKTRVIVQFERRFLQDIMAENQGNITKSARRAGKHRRAFYELLKKHSLVGQASKADNSARI